MTSSERKRTTTRNEAAERLRTFLIDKGWSHQPFEDLEDALAAERAGGYAEGSRATVERMLARFDAAWRDFDGAYGSPRPKWAIAKIRAAMADEEAAR